MCRTSLFDLENRFPHTKHKQGFSPVCVRRWHCKSDDRGNRALQISHAYGFSPVCRRMWTTKFDELEKLRPQYEHKCLLTIASRSSGGTWTRIWVLRMEKSVWNGIQIFCHDLLYLMLSKRLNCFWQISQVNRLVCGKCRCRCASNWSAR